MLYCKNVDDVCIRQARMSTDGLSLAPVAAKLSGAACKCLPQEGGLLVADPYHPSSISGIEVAVLCNPCMQLLARPCLRAPTLPRVHHTASCTYREQLLI